MLQIPLRVHHASMLVNDTQKSLEFYCGVLGLPLTERPKLEYPGAWLQLGEQQLHLIELPSPDPKTGRPAHGGHDRHVALTISDVDQIKEELEKANIPFTLSKSGRRALFCRDRDGNALEFIERA